MTKTIQHSVGVDLPSIPHFDCADCAEANKDQNYTKYTGSGDDHHRLDMDILDVKPVSFEGIRYVGNFQYSKTSWSEARYYSKKSENGPAAIAVISMLERQHDMQIQVLRSNKGGENTSDALADFCGENGIEQQFGEPGDKRENARIERHHRTLTRMTRADLHASSVPKGFWPESFQCNVYKKNRMYSTRHNMSPFEKTYGKKPDIRNFRTFGCLVFYKNWNKSKIPKMQKRGTKGVFMGYSPESDNGFHILD